jgi:peptide/nickel transport system ATP-binding protein
LTRPFLSVRDLVVTAGRPSQPRIIVNGVSFEIGAGERLALVGESGSGKTMTALAIIGLLPPGLSVASGAIALDGQALEPGGAAMQAARGRDIAMIFQDPTTSLNPVMTVGQQIIEAIRVHNPVSQAVARGHAITLLDQVKIERPEERVDDYPHQFSGGMRQRVMIAMALANRPKLLIADEPTTALDVTTQIEILRLVDELCRANGMALLLITHDLGIVQGFCDRIVVLYAGAAMEGGPVAEVLARPRHPYTRGLLRSVPPADSDVEWLEPIVGEPPVSVARQPGCPFAPRCAHALDRCRTTSPTLQSAGAGVIAACHLLDTHAADMGAPSAPHSVGA